MTREISDVIWRDQPIRHAAEDHASRVRHEWVDRQG
jgi:hypothetical protein